MEATMSNSSILGGTTRSSGARGRDVDALGPSDSSDSGSDVQGERAMPTAPDNAGEFGAVVVDGDTDSDALGTGERASATGDDPRDGADIMPNRIENDGTMQPDSPLDVPLPNVADIAADDDDADDARDSEYPDVSDDDDAARR
jgi:hypothetical protein